MRFYTYLTNSASSEIWVWHCIYFCLFQSTHTTPGSDDSPLGFPSFSSSASLCSRASKMSSSAMSVIAATATSKAQVVGTLESEAPQPTDELCTLLGPDDACMLVDILKIALSSGCESKETLSKVLAGTHPGRSERTVLN